MSTGRDIMERVVVRRATNEDFDGVMHISKDIYNGRDIVPAMYFKYMANPAKHGVVAELDGEIVAFEIAHIVDDGRTAVMQAGRSAPNLRGRGILRLMDKRFFTDILYPRYPRIARRRTLSIDTDFWDSKDDGTEIIARRVVISLGGVPVPCADFASRLTPQRMEALRQQLPIDSLSPADGNTLNNILADHASKKHIFPEGVMVRDVDVFDANESNTQMATHGCSAIFVTRSASSTYESLSFGRGSECQLGCRYIIDYYGTRDHSTILAHVSRHLPLVCEVSRGRPVLIHLLLPEAWLGDELKRRVNEFAVANVTSTGQSPRYFKMYTMTHPLSLPNPRL